MAIIQIEHVSKTFQTKDGTIDALKDVSLNIEAGDIYGIIGMSGAGKSTLVRCINHIDCLLYTSPSPRDRSVPRMPSSA